MTNSMIRPEIVDLFVPTHRPEVLTYELDSIEGVGEQLTVMA